MLFAILVPVVMLPFVMMSMMILLPFVRVD